ncbi:hypothetical protein NMY22_g20018 [Coprinellus aureogranulatus]|nr:hypothetical protein NMY22_g20018 [Coprinellus aureogranulatus]
MINNLLAAMTVVACATATLALPAPVPRGFFLQPFGFPMAGQGLSMPGLSPPSSGPPGFPGMPFDQGFTGAGFPGFWPYSGSSGMSGAGNDGSLQRDDTYLMRYWQALSQLPLRERQPLWSPLNLVSLQSPERRSKADPAMLRLANAHNGRSPLEDFCDD